MASVVLFCPQCCCLYVDNAQPNGVKNISCLPSLSAGRKSEDQAQGNNLYFVYNLKNPQSDGTSFQAVALLVPSLRGLSILQCYFFPIIIYFFVKYSCKVPNLNIVIIIFFNCFYKAFIAFILN